MQQFVELNGIVPCNMVTRDQIQTLCNSNCAAICSRGREHVLVAPQYLADKPMEIEFVPLAMKLSLVGSASNTVTRLLTVFHPDVNDISVCKDSYTIRIANNAMSLSQQSTRTIIQIQSLGKLIGFLETISWNLPGLISDCEHGKKPLDLVLLQPCTCIAQDSKAEVAQCAKRVLETDRTSKRVKVDL